VVLQHHVKSTDNNENKISRVFLNEQEVLLAHKLAAVASAKENRRRGFYGTDDGRGWNSPIQQLVGKFGEVAVKQYLSAPQLKVFPYFEDLNRKSGCDIAIDYHGASVHIEVKTWRITDWEKFGRCIRPEQFPKMFLHRELVIWCCVETNNLDISKAKLISVQIMGFFMVHDLIEMRLNETAPNALNYQLDVSHVRGMHELSEAFISFALYKRHTAQS
jgi:hypothetical protein